jgi:hypothetical protein
MSEFLIASNTSAVFIRTQGSLGTFADPTTVNEDGTGGSTGLYAVRVVGTPKFTPRGAGIIQRTDIYTPFGGGQAAVTGGIGWDITFQTELFWRFDEASGTNPALITTAQSQLSALWLASPWAVTLPATSDVLLTVQPYFYADVDRVAAAYAVQPFSIVYEESNGKRYEAFDCVCVPKFSWESGGKIMVDWTVKGKWLDVTTSTNTLPIYPEQYSPTAKPQPPLIGQAAALALSGFFGAATNALSKVTVDTGWAISDVADARQTHGFGLGFIALTTYPTIALEVANFAETAQPDWTDAQDNTVNSNDLTVTLAIGSNSIVFTLAEPQLIEWPAPGEANGYRNIGLKFGGIPFNAATSPQTTVMSILFNS